MKNIRVLWVLAVIITLSSAVYQRMTGPTYPARGNVTLGGQSLTLRLTRTYAGAGDQPVIILASDTGIAGEVAWRRYPTKDEWQRLPLVRTGDTLRTALPHQPVAGKLEYQAHLQRGSEAVLFPERPAVTRFRDDIPAYVLIPHVSAMFFFMLFSTVAGLAAFARLPQARRYAIVGAVLLAVGGFVLGPIMQKFAFGDWWTGIPFGWDVTDNKTLFAAIAWAIALWRMRGGQNARTAMMLAAVATLVVFAIPHSAWGSEVKWEQMPK